MKAFTVLLLVGLCMLLLSEVDCQRGNGRGGKKRGGNGRRGGNRGNRGKNRKDRFRDDLGICKCNDTTQQPINVVSGTGEDRTIETICVPKHICYNTCPTTPCELPTVVCELVDTATVKPGNCPKYYFTGKKGRKATGIDKRKDDCTNDSDCRGRQKCCTMAPSNQPRCIDPVPVGDKCGSCPAENSKCTVKPKDRDFPCTGDEDCPGKRKCCQCQDIQKCVKPRTPHTMLDEEEEDDGETEEDNDNLVEDDGDGIEEEEPIFLN